MASLVMVKWHSNSFRIHIIDIPKAEEYTHLLAFTIGFEVKILKKNGELVRWLRKHATKTTVGFLFLLLGAIVANTPLGVAGIVPMLVGMPLVFMGITRPS